MLMLMLSVVVMLHADADADRVRELVRLPAGPSGRDAPLESGLSARRAQTQQVTPLLELWVDAPPCQARARAREPLLARGSRARRAWRLRGFGGHKAWVHGRKIWVEERTNSQAHSTSES